MSTAGPRDVRDWMTPNEVEAHKKAYDHDKAMKEKMQWMHEQDQKAKKYGLMTAVPVKEGGMKYDSDKPRTDLLDPLAMEGLAAVLAFGARKYAANNWRNGISYTRLLGAALRHTFAILRGEDNDPESGLPHVDHLGCCWMFLSAHFKYEYLKKFDDRWKPPV